MQTFDPRIYAVGECVQHRGACYASSRRCSSRRRSSRTISRSSASAGTRARRRPRNSKSRASICFRRRLHGRHRHRGATVPGRGARRVQEDRREGQQDHGRRAVRRYGRRLVVLPAAARRHADRGFPRQPAVRPGARRRLGRRRSRSVANLPDKAEICGCNGVCKGDIVRAISTKKLFTLDESGRTRRPPPPAARARVSSSNYSRPRSAATTPRRRPRSPCACARRTRTRKSARRSRARN